MLFSHISPKDVIKPVVVRTQVGFEFHTDASEVAVLDGRGNAVWRKRRGGEIGPLQWDGMDLWGNNIRIGSYICKLISATGHIRYFPFVFSR